MGALWAPVAEALGHSRNQDPPNYVHVHICNVCKRNYLCPDRWLSNECAPTKHANEMGWNPDVHGCMPCLAMLPDGDINKDAWWEAHGTD